MSATEDDTELRDLLIQNLENSGVLSKLKAETRAAVFLAMEEQDRVESKTPLINENLRRCLSSRDGQLAASLIMDFLQVFNLDFTLAVFQPEINSLNSMDSRDLVCRELGLSESQVNRNSPVLLELVRRGYHKDKVTTGTEDSEFAASLGKGILKQQASDNRTSSLSPKRERLDLDLEVEDDIEDGDSFFDDPLPKPQKTYGCRGSPVSGEKDLSQRTNSHREKVGESVGRESPAGYLSEPLRPGGGGESSVSDQNHSRNGVEQRSRDTKAPSDRVGSAQSDEDVEYDDDFNSHRSDLSRSELSVGEDIEEVSIEGPDTSDKYDETTQDLSVSQISQSHAADYMEDVA